MHKDTRLSMCRICKQCKIVYEEGVEKHFHKCNLSPDGYDKICRYCKLGNRHTVAHIDTNGDILCTKCLTYKTEDEYDTNQSMWFRKYRDRRCKPCKKLQYDKRRVANRGDLGIERLLTERFAGLRDRAIRNGLVLDFDKEYLRELWVSQGQKCAISGVEMTTVFYSGRTPSNMSVDRIDSSKGYIKDNVQLVCMAVNQMKSDLTTEELLYYCKRIIDNYGKETNTN